MTDSKNDQQKVFNCEEENKAISEKSFLNFTKSSLACRHLDITSQCSFLFFFQSQMLPSKELATQNLSDWQSQYCKSFFLELYT